MDRASIYRETFRHFLRPILPLMDDPAVTEIMVIGPDCVYCERKGVISLTELKFPDETALLAAVRHVAEFVGRPLGPASPTLDARLPDGSRVHAILPPAARRGICLTIRRFLKASFDLKALVRSGSISRDAARLLVQAVRLRKNILISGGTGTGKTSFLNALSTAIPPEERILVIEDSSELQLAQPHTVYLESQPADEDGEGELTIRDLFVNALRMRPDRIIVGEVRRGEALDLVQSMISGHPGSLATIHASDPHSALLRLELLSRMNPVPLPPDVARAQIALAIDVVVQLARLREGVRRVVSVAESAGLDSAGQYAVRELYRFRTPPGGGPGRLEPTGIAPRFADEAEAYGLSLKPRNGLAPASVGAIEGGIDP
jgi:pilus assembly protein CpaF